MCSILSVGRRAGPGKTAFEAHAKPIIAVPTDAIVEIEKTTICGTDLYILKGDLPSCTPGRILGHEGVGVIDSRLGDRGNMPSILYTPLMSGSNFVHGIVGRGGLLMLDAVKPLEQGIGFSRCCSGPATSRTAMP